MPADEHGFFQVSADGLWERSWECMGGGLGRKEGVFPECARLIKGRNQLFLGVNQSFWAEKWPKKIDFSVKTRGFSRQTEREQPFFEGIKD